MDWERIKEKLKSKVVWVTAVPLICYLIYSIKSGVVDLEQFMLTLVSLLALFGILNDPNDRERF